VIHGYYGMNWFVVSYYDKDFFYSIKPKVGQIENIEPSCLPNYIVVR
jgi:hypothetical protein